VPLVIPDTGYSVAALTAALAGCLAHLLVRLPSGSVLYGAPGGAAARPRDGTPVTRHNRPGPADPGPGESLILPGTPHCGTVRGTLLRVIAERLPDGRRPHATIRSGHMAGGAQGDWNVPRKMAARDQLRGHSNCRDKAQSQRPALDRG
jgi:hypothetical protein